MLGSSQRRVRIALFASILLTGSILTRGHNHNKEATKTIERISINGERSRLGYYAQNQSVVVDQSTDYHLVRVTFSEGISALDFDLRLCIGSRKSLSCQFASKDGYIVQSKPKFLKKNFLAFFTFQAHLKFLIFTPKRCNLRLQDLRVQIPNTKKTPKSKPLPLNPVSKKEQKLIQKERLIPKRSISATKRALKVLTLLLETCSSSSKTE